MPVTNYCPVIHGLSVKCRVSGKIGVLELARYGADHKVLYPDRTWRWFIPEEFVPVFEYAPGTRYYCEVTGVEGRLIGFTVKEILDPGNNVESIARVKVRQVPLPDYPVYLVRLNNGNDWVILRSEIGNVHDEYGVCVTELANDGLDVKHVMEWGLGKVHCGVIRGKNGFYWVDEEKKING